VISVNNEEEQNTTIIGVGIRSDSTKVSIMSPRPPPARPNQQFIPSPPDLLERRLSGGTLQ